MTHTTLRGAIDKAQYIKFHDHRDVFVAWFGGHTFNVYSTRAEQPGAVVEVDVFSLYGEEGEAPTNAEAEDKAREILADME
jgi:hypothetical protein